jgi:hypothetical protein
MLIINESLDLEEKHVNMVGNPFESVLQFEHPSGCVCMALWISKAKFIHS